MGVEVGVVIGLIGVGILIVPFIIQIVIGRKQTSTGAKRALEGASGIIAIAVIFFIGGILLSAYYSGKEIAAGGARYSGKGGKFLEEHPQLALLAA